MPMKRIVKSIALVCLMGAALAGKAQTSNNTPLGSPYKHTDDDKKLFLPYDYLRQADVAWEKYIWRVIDIREKMNLPFKYPVQPFITILRNLVGSNEITVYNPVN